MKILLNTYATITTNKFHRANCSRPPSGSICSVFRSKLTLGAQLQPNLIPRSDRGSIKDEAGSWSNALHQVRKF